MLGISCMGERKFRVQRVWRAADGLNMGEVAWLTEEPTVRSPPGTRGSPTSLRRALADSTSTTSYVERNSMTPSGSAAASRSCCRSSPNDKQALLEIDDPIGRLDALACADRRRNEADGHSGSRGIGAACAALDGVSHADPRYPYHHHSATPITTVHASTIQPMNPS